jgi:hypothetical protein
VVRDEHESLRNDRLPRGSLKSWLPLGFAVLVLVLFATWVYLIWDINESVYAAKAGLNWLGIRFYFGYTFIAAALLSLLLINPRVGQSDLWGLLTLLSSNQGFGHRLDPYNGVGAFASVTVPPMNKRTWALWQVSKWLLGVFIFVSFEGVPFVGQVMNSIMMMVMGLGDWRQVFRVFLLPLFPASSSDLVNLMPTMEIQYRVVNIVIGAVLIVIITRTVIRTLVKLSMSSGAWTTDIVSVGGALIADIVSVAAAFLFYVILGAPYWLMNITTGYIYGAVWVLLGFSLLSWGYFKSLEKENRKRLISEQGFKRVATVFGVALLVLVGVVAFFHLNWNNNYISYEWNLQTDKQIAVTRWAAGLNNIKVGSLLALPTSNSSTTLRLVRQWDQTAAAVTMTKEIGAYNWMGLASSEIVFLNTTEYWVAPTASTFPSSNWISEHLIYTHAARIMVINTHNGSEVSPEKAFSINAEPLIYYGQTPTSGQGGFQNNVYVHVPGYDEVQNVTYSGKPDYTLDGWQKAFWFIFSENQFGFAFSGYPIDMLWNRDVYSRVQDILIPGLVIDPAAYLASDGKNVYYVMQIYTDYPLQSEFSASPYLRFFGVVLVNVYDGSIQGYTIHNLIPTDSSDFITQYYGNYYSTWKTAPNWLIPQLRYPEALLGAPSSPGQLDYHFMYHVNDPFVWRSGSEFYERPESNIVQYIPWAVGDKTYFVGIQLAHFQSAQSKNLAGVYIAYGGDKLGQIDLYQNPSPSNTFIGPSAAENALTTNSEVRTQLTFLPNYRIGSYLLYSVGGQLEYFVAVYTSPGTEGVVTQLPFMTAISPATGSVGVGSNADTAYYNLLQGRPSTSPTADMSEFYKRLTSLTSSYNYAYINATSVNPTVWINTGTFTFSGQNLDNLMTDIKGFLDTYGSDSVDHTVYTWMTTPWELSVGVFQDHSGVLKLYYIVVNFK